MKQEGLVKQAVRGQMWWVGQWDWEWDSESGSYQVRLSFSLSVYTYAMMAKDGNVSQERQSRGKGQVHRIPGLFSQVASSFELDSSRAPSIR